MPKRSREPPAAAKKPSADPPPPSVFAPDALEPSAPRAAFKEATPYMHVRLPSLFDEASLLSVRRELQQLSSTFKETDLFKVYQTGDLGNLDARNPEHAALLPATLALRSALYSEAFRSYVRQVTGCAPITDQQDCSCNQYKRGGHLLCHDDVIGTRCVSYILYLARPGKPWRPELGGALELYEVSDDTGDVLPSPVSALAPEFGSMVLFTVQPGKSFHAVQEVASKAPRLSISGWFHAAHPPDGADSAASLAQLQSAHERGAAPAKALTRAPKPGRALSSAQEQRLHLVVNPAYLHPSTIAAVRQQLEADGAALLSSFLHPALAEQIRKRAALADAKDGLGQGGLPPHSAGAKRKGWRLVGPPQLRRYMRYKAPKAARTTSGGEGGGEGGEEGGGEGGEEGGGEGGEGEDSGQPAAPPTVGALLEEVRRVMHSAPFVQLMSALSGQTPSHCSSEVRRFRPGLDYTLAHTGTVRAAPETLDATLCFVAAAPAELALWDSGDVGGFECHVASSSEDEHGAAEVYKADESSAGVTSIHAACNALSLVAREADTMKFIKYVSFAAPSSRWDVAAEYTARRDGAE